MQTVQEREREIHENLMDFVQKGSVFKMKGIDREGWIVSIADNQQFCFFALLMLSVWQKPKPYQYLYATRIQFVFNTN